MFYIFFIFTYKGSRRDNYVLYIIVSLHSQKINKITHICTAEHIGVWLAESVCVRNSRTQQKFEAPKSVIALYRYYKDLRGITIFYI